MRFWKFSKGFFLAEIREFEVVFWSIVFPLLLYFFLSSVLGGEGKPAGAAFELGYVRQVNASASDMVMHSAVEAITGPEGPFKATQYDDLAGAIEELKLGKLDVAVVWSGKPETQDISVQIHAIEGKESSGVAANILQAALDMVNLEVAKAANPGYVDITLKSEAVTVTPKSKSVDYKDYLFPSVALMMMLSVSLLNSPLSLSFYRSSGTNRKVFTTPLRPMEFFAAHLVKLIVTMLISLVLLYAMAWFIYGVRDGIFSAGFFLALILGMGTLVSIGLMIAAITGKESSVIVIGQISYQLMMFMGGFFFPVMSLPWTVRWLVYLVPTSYLVELLRRGMGIQSTDLSNTLLIAVPLAWMTVAAIVFSMRFRKVMGHE